jgi:N4-gp56 family major capsid protein
VPTTMLSNLINPQVLSDSIQLKFGNLIRFNQIARREVINGAGSVITVPRYAYIGDAAVVAEGVAVSPAALSQTSVTVAIQKAMKAVQFTDESMKHGLGDPLGEGEDQIATAIAQKIDADIAAALETVPAPMRVAETATVASLPVLVNALKKFGEDIDEHMFLYIGPDQLAQLRVDSNFVMGKEAGRVGLVGEIYGMSVIVSGRVPAKVMYIVKPGAVGIYLKGGVETEFDRDVLAKTEVVVASQYYGIHLRNDSKAIRIQLT